MLSSCDRATRLLSVMVKVTESTLSAESGCKRRLLGSKFCSRTLARKLRDGRILPQLDKGIDLPGLPAHPEIQLVQHREDHRRCSSRPGPRPHRDRCRGQCPAQALVQRPAAVVRPLIWLRLVTMIVPAPRKPMPLMTWAPKRAGSPDW